MTTDLVYLGNGAEDNGLANMVADLIRQNLADRPEKRGDFDALRGTIALEARDIEVAITLVFDGGRCEVHSGVRGSPHLKVATDSDTILGLTLLKVRLGLPSFFDEAGRGVLKKLLARELVISGLLLHPVLLVRFTRLLSVAE